MQASEVAKSVVNDTLETNKLGGGSQYWRKAEWVRGWCVKIKIGKSNITSTFLLISSLFVSYFLDFRRAQSGCCRFCSQWRGIESSKSRVAEIDSHGHSHGLIFLNWNKTSKFDFNSIMCTSNTWKVWGTYFFYISLITTLLKTFFTSG